MTAPRKQRPGDEGRVFDSTADPVERASAMSRLAADGRSDLIPVAEEWLDSPHSMLRKEAVNLLLSLWKQESQVAGIIERLHRDPDADVRCMVARCLSGFLKSRPEFKEDILRALVRALQNDSDRITQRRCYKELLQHIVPDNSQRHDVPNLFEPDRDVDWTLLAPWRAP